MICPFCQHDLDIEAMACPRCCAVYPHQRGPSFRFKLRTLVISGVMALMGTYILSSCVFADIQSNTIVSACTQYSSGGSCQIQTGQTRISPQNSQFGGPNMLDADAQLYMSMVNSGQQGTQNNPFTRPSKTPAR